MTKSKGSKIAFVVPVYKHDPRPVVSKIEELFPKSKLVLIDDGQGVQIKSTRLYKRGVFWLVYYL